MKLARIEWHGQVCYGAYEDGRYHLIKGDVFDTYERTEQVVEPARLLAPCCPSKVVCVGLNYLEHQKELQDYAQGFPKLFIKPSTCLIGDGDKIVRPAGVARVDYEAELAVVIGKRAKNIAKGTARTYILGYTCMNDVTAREIQAQDVQWTRAKSYDTFAPLGPYIETEADPAALEIRLLKNGQVMQQANTREMIWGIDFLVEELSKIMTLLPGDVIATGTPSGCGPMEDGDMVQVEIEQVGVLTNYLTKEG